MDDKNVRDLLTKLRCKIQEDVLKEFEEIVNEIEELDKREKREKKKRKDESEETSFWAYSTSTACKVFNYEDAAIALCPRNKNMTIIYPNGNVTYK